MLKSAFFFHIAAVNIEYLIAVNNIAVFINSKAAVSIAVKGKACIKLLLLHKLLKSLNVCGAAVCVDIQSVRVVVYNVCFCAQSVKYTFGNIEGRAVCAVKTYSFAFK